MQQVGWDGTHSQGMQETKRWKQTRVSGNESNIGYTIWGKLAALTQWKTAGTLVDSDKHRRVPRWIPEFPFNQWSESPTKRLPEWWAEAVWESAYPQTEGNSKSKLRMFYVCLTILQNLPAVWRCTEWGHSFTFEKRNSRLKIQAGNQKKLTQENNLFYFYCRVPEFKMSSNSVKLDSAMNWHRRLTCIEWIWSRMHQRQWRNRRHFHCVRTGQDHKDSSTKSGRNPSRAQTGEGVHRRAGTIRSKVTIKVPIRHFVCRPVREVLSETTPKKLRQDDAQGLSKNKWKRIV